MPIYTIPRINKGKEPNTVKGSTKKKEWVKNSWYVSYSFRGKQYKEKDGINRIHDYDERLEAAEVLRQSLEDDLKKGYDPTNPLAYQAQLAKQSITLAEAVKNYLSNTAHLRKSSVDSYTSKLRHLVKAYPNICLKDLTSEDIEDYIRSQIDKTEFDEKFTNGEWLTLDSVTQWTPATVDAAVRIFTTFFLWCTKKKQSYISESPMKHIDKNRIKSTVEAEDTNIPYTEDDLQTVMAHLDEHDPFVAFFCRFVYYTLLRPREICGLRVKDIDLVRKQITVPLAIAKTMKKKNPKPETIDIVPQFFPLIENLNLHQYQHDYYVVSADETKIVGTKWLDPEKPYKRLVNHLKTLELQGKGYTLYGLKHTSNILRFKSRTWELDDIMKANRHADLQMTMKYLKDITRTTDIANKEVPSI